MQINEYVIGIYISLHHSPPNLTSYKQHSHNQTPLFLRRNPYLVILQRYSRNVCIYFQAIYIFVACTLAATVAAQTARPAVSDTALEDALNDKRFIQRQLKCALGEAPCDPIGKRLKSTSNFITLRLRFLTGAIHESSIHSDQNFRCH